MLDFLSRNQKYLIMTAGLVSVGYIWYAPAVLTSAYSAISVSVLSVRELKRHLTDYLETESV